MQAVPDILKTFKSIGLRELDKAALLDRIDTKYVFSTDQLPEILKKLKDDYFVLELDNNRMFNYNSLYYDTDDFLLYNLHATGRLNRFKVRWRKYVESGISFFEIKFKNNKGRTIKSRIKITTDDAFDSEAISLLKEQTPFTFNELKPKFWVNYLRITMVSLDFKERLTIDLNLTFKSITEEKTLTNLVIAEVKQGKAGNSVFSKIMKDAHIRQGSLSKYCYGVVSLFDTIRKNNFKRQVLHINKILYATPAGY